jgi:hypothetical protein
VSLSGGTASFDNQNVGTGKVVTVTELSLTGGAAGNYALDSDTVTASADITPATLIVTANNAARTYGLPNPPFTASYLGFVGGDTEEVLSGAPDLSTTATQASAPGSYPISAGQGSLSATNYLFSFVDGTLTIGDSVELSNVRVGADQFNFSFPTIAGQSYQVEYSTNLSSGVWLPLGDSIPGTGDVITATNSVAGSQLFFRLNIQPQ